MGEKTQRRMGEVVLEKLKSELLAIRSGGMKTDEVKRRDHNGLFHPQLES